MRWVQRIIRPVTHLTRCNHAKSAAIPAEKLLVATQDENFAKIDFGVDKLTSLQELFEARVHLGHKRGMWHPNMLPYLYGHRAGIHIIDLDKTWKCIQVALNVISHVAYRNGIILFVNERPQFARLNQKAARDSDQYFITKWNAGTLTNMQRLLGTMTYPDLMIFTSVPPNESAVKEAAMCCVPSIGIVDSDCDPQYITYPIPGNDDTPSALQLYFRIFSQAIRNANTERTLKDPIPTPDETNKI